MIMQMFCKYEFKVMAGLNLLRTPLMPYSTTCLNDRQNRLKQYKNPTNRYKQRKKEESYLFGRILETRKEKAKREQLTQRISTPQISRDYKPNGNFGDDSERSWALNISSSRKLIIKGTPKQTKICESFPNSSKVVIPEKNSTVTTDIVDLPADGKNKNIDIGSIKNASLIHTAKSDVDKWTDLTIRSLPSNRNDHEYSLPGVTTILKESMSDQAKLMLENWEKKMILQLGVVGFETYRTELLQSSKLMHRLIENTLRKEPIDVPEHLRLTYKSISSILEDIKDVRFIETQVVHPTLGYRGFIDCVATYKGNLCVIDWKKSDKLKTFNTMYDSPLQISAYIGALNSDENYPFKVKTGLVAFAYAHGQPPSVFELSGATLEFYWKEWLKRLEKYYAMR